MRYGRMLEDYGNIRKGGLVNFEYIDAEGYLRMCEKKGDRSRCYGPHKSQIQEITEDEYNKGESKMEFITGKEYQLPQGKMVLDECICDELNFIDNGEVRVFRRDWAELNAKEVPPEPYSDLEVGDLCWVWDKDYMGKCISFYVKDGKFANNLNIRTTYNWKHYEKLGFNIKDKLNLNTKG